MKLRIRVTEIMLTHLECQWLVGDGEKNTKLIQRGLLSLSTAMTSSPLLPEIHQWWSHHYVAVKFHPVFTRGHYFSFPCRALLTPWKPSVIWHNILKDNIKQVQQGTFTTPFIIICTAHTNTHDDTHTKIKRGQLDTSKNKSSPNFMFEKVSNIAATFD
jgi:hypothetical protein